MRFTYTVDINSTPEVVFSWLGTPERAMVWQTNVSKSEILHETPDMIGTTFREIVEENGRGVEMSGVVTDYKKDKTLAMHLESKYNSVDIAYQIEEIEDRTRLTLISNIRFRSFLRILSIVLWPVFRKKLLGQLNREYSRLKEICEQGT